jgi:hypothetical protein
MWLTTKRVGVAAVGETSESVYLRENFVGGPWRAADLGTEKESKYQA